MHKTLFPVVLFIVSCSGGLKSDQRNSVQQDLVAVDSLNRNNDLENDQPTSNDVNLAKSWLIDAIDRHFNRDLHSFKLITTDEYYGFKIDVINSNYEQGIDLDSIKKKWSYKYDISSEDIDVGFLIDAQDNGKIEIESCKFLNSSTNSTFVFSISLYDTLFKAHYKSYVTVVPYNGSYAIDYVKEYFK